MNSREIPLRERDCPCCGTNDFENLWSYKHTTKTQSKTWGFNVFNVICQNCGFVGTSPVVDNDVLLEYYTDSFSKFTQQTIDYDVEKRIAIIQAYSPKDSKVFVEVGSNQKTLFHKRMDSYFQDVITIEPNDSAESDFRSVEEVSKITANCIAHYFVLEHVPKVHEFLRECSSMLTDDGIMICEVPSLELYDEFVSPMILFEHVNHFTPSTLATVAAKEGFEMIFHSSEACSRPFGFVAVFKKSQKKANITSEYQQNKLFFKRGMDKVEIFFRQMKSAKRIIDELNSRGQRIIVWAANETTNRLFSDKEIPKNVTIIDSDPRKQTYFYPSTTVYQPDQMEKELKEVNHIIICTKLHANAILTSVKAKYNKTFKSENILIVDLL